MSPAATSVRPARRPPEPIGELWPDGTWKSRVRQRLLRWYAAHARPLSWRKSQDPYRVWVSEIMLQQTQTSTVEGYFARFLAAFPTVDDLAAADLDRVLRLWEGLGYYRRARQMHLAAQQVVAQHSGRFPTDIESVRALPGIGRYTAGAILSIGCDARQPILEANTVRLFSRLLAYRDDPTKPAGQKLLWAAAEQLLPMRNCGAFNQALMDVGSQICQPRTPRCSECPLVDLCPTFAAGLSDVIPALPARAVPTAVRHVAVVVRRGTSVLLVRQPEAGRWGNLWDFVRFDETDAAELDHENRIAVAVQQRTGQRVAKVRPLVQLKHGVTRWRITLDCFEASFSGTAVKANKNLRWVRLDAIDEVPLSSTGRKIADKLKGARSKG